jgi:hypothetical protein
MTTTPIENTVTGIQCPLCEEVLVSLWGHDFHYCECGYCFVDGGRNYLRYGYGIPYPHEGTPAQQKLSMLATRRIGVPSTIVVLVSDIPNLPRQRRAADELASGPKRKIKKESPSEQSPKKKAPKKPRARAQKIPLVDATE